MPAGTVKSFKPSKYIPVAAATVFLVGSTTLFFTFTCPWLNVEVSPALTAYNAIMFLFVLANFSMATFMDPGIFPRDVMAAGRYIKRSQNQSVLSISPPFLRPEVSESQIGLKILDNGIQSPLQHYQSRSSLELTESQSADAEPPPPPKPDLSRYAGLRGQLSLTEREDNSLLNTESPPTPTMYRFRPGFSSGSGGPAPSAKLPRVDSLQDSPMPNSDLSRPPSSRSEPSLEADSCHAPPARSSSLRSATGTPAPLPSLPSEGTTSTSYKSLNQTQNGSLSYQSLLSPSDETEPETAGYSSPYLSARERLRPACPPPIAPRYGKPRIAHHRAVDTDAAALPLLTLK
ncbi:hypothetical protein GDO78_018653 [Eleutherodactylus coqui]|uniref:protein S-acyltransferase n=1 Tax=Eleutherodactylus coqui TaxID=57060 RepID=A0A8J6BLM1_ELECQ|nr:hypothetical protein GDO78_018653 [Eleutherodactylus coqui]